MKRFASKLLLAILVFGMLPFSAFATVTAEADVTTYYLEELGMSIDVPDEYAVFTRETADEDPNLKKYGITKEEVQDILIAGNIYLNAVEESGSHEINVTMVESPLADFSSYKDSVLSYMVGTFIDGLESYGVEYIKSYFYRQNEETFIKVYTSQPHNDSTVYTVQYYTVHSGMAINVTLHSFEGSITVQQETVLKHMVNSVHFGLPVKTTEEPIQKELVLYRDATSGIAFSIPEGWEEKPLTKEYSVLKAKFQYMEKLGVFIQFSAENYWDSLSVYEKILITKDCSITTILSKEDIVEMYNCEMEDISLITCGSIQYYRVECEIDGAAYGLNITVPVIYLMGNTNGCLVTFALCQMADSNEQYYNDFISMAQSVKCESDS